MFIKDNAFFKRNQLMNISFKQISTQLPLPFLLDVPYSPLSVKTVPKGNLSCLDWRRAGDTCVTGSTLPVMAVS